MSDDERYDPATIEPKWQAFWDKDDTFHTPESPGEKSVYILDMFPYPSGAGLHVGHPEGYTATDIVARFRRAQGWDVLHPMGFDSFGLPAEQYAVKTGTHPAVTTKNNIDTFRRQLKMLGFSYDWKRELATTDPEYVRWTQWIFLQLFHAGLAYQDDLRVNWCPALGTVLANEEVIDGKSERGGHPVERRAIRQWVLKITEYADRLLKGLDDVEWPSSTRTMQEEWIGRSEGAEVTFGVVGHDETLEVYTTRPDTLFGATFMVLAPEHPLVSKITTDERRTEVDDYVAAAKNRSDRDRQKQKTGVFTGGFAINPVNGAEVPVWIADYVLWGYGTGAIMAVPAHDTRDFEFATKYEIPIVEVVSEDGKPSEGALSEARPDPGIAVRSGKYDGMKTAEMKKAITTDLEKDGKGKGRTQYKLRDWIFSRQRYWGEPFPIYFPVKGDADPRQGEEGVDFTVDYDSPIAVEELELPVQLPELEDYKPGDDPRGVLARATDWRFFQKDGKWFARETNTMPQWAGSCWYYLRFCDPHNQEKGWSEKAVKDWLPVDLYVGGAEHAVLHLLYARFWHMVLYDQGHVPVPEPFTKLVHQGMILGEIEMTAYDGPSGRVSAELVRAVEDEDDAFELEDGTRVKPVRVGEDDVEKRKDGQFALKSDAGVAVHARAFKMSKSRGNVVNPDDIIQRFGADALRTYEMQMGPLEATKPWATESIGGVRRFLDRCWRLSGDAADVEPSEEILRETHKCIDKVTQDIESLKLNTAIAAMMILSRALQKAKGGPPKSCVKILAQLVHPFAPHLGEEMWERLGEAPSIQKAPWPDADPALVQDEVIEIPVQIMGKKRAIIHVPADADEATAVAAAKQVPKIAEALEQGTLRKTIWVPGRILNFIIGGR